MRCCLDEILVQELAHDLLSRHSILKLVQYEFAAGMGVHIFIVLQGYQCLRRRLQPQLKIGSISKYTCLCTKCVNKLRLGEPLDVIPGCLIVNLAFRPADTNFPESDIVISVLDLRTYLKRYIGLSTCILHC